MSEVVVEARDFSLPEKSAMKMNFTVNDWQIPPELVLHIVSLESVMYLLLSNCLSGHTKHFKAKNIMHCFDLATGKISQGGNFCSFLFFRNHIPASTIELIPCIPNFDLRLALHMIRRNLHYS